MNDYKNDHLAEDEKLKQSWTVKKLAQKGGRVLRAAMLTQDDKHTPEWVQVEGRIES